MKYPYDVIVLGGGMAGCMAASVAAGFGARTLLIEKDMSGTNGSWQRTVPVKALLFHAGKNSPGVPLEPDQVFEKLLELKEEAYRGTEHPEHLKAFGVELVEGKGVFCDDHTIEIEKKDGKTIRVRAKSIIIAVGSRPFIPEIEGIGKTPYLTPDTLFKKPWVPDRMAVIGAGPAGIELGQALQRLGSQVTLFEQNEKILPAFSAHATNPLLSVLKKEGVVIYSGCRIISIKGDEHRVFIQVSNASEEKIIEADRILFATGRSVTPEKIHPRRAGIHYTSKGIPINKRCRTNIRHIYAIGDITGEFHQAQMALHMAQVAVINALFKIPVKSREVYVPKVVFSDPEVASVGFSPESLKQKGKAFEWYQLSYQKMGRAIMEDTPEGWIHVYVKKWTGKILGAHITGRNAGETISLFTLAMKHGMPLRKIAVTSFPFSSYSLGIQKVAEQWHLSPERNHLYKWIKKFFGLQGKKG